MTTHSPVLRMAAKCVFAIAMKNCWCGIEFAALVCASCTRQVQTVSHGAARSSVATVMTRQVQNAADAGDGDLEARNLRNRLAANSKDLNARIALAKLYSQRGFPDLALEHYRLAAAQFPQSPVVTLALAKTLREMDHPQEALKAARDFLTANPSAWELLSLEGILEDEAGDFKSAENAHRGALAMQPSRGALHNNLGYNLLLQGKSDVAADEFRRAVDLDPRSVIAHNNLGTALAAQSHPPAEALAELKRSADPAVAHNNLAAVLIQQGRYPEARVELEAALKYRHDFPEAMANLRLVSEKDGQPVALSSTSSAKRWKNFRSSVGRLFGGPPNTSPSSGKGDL